jgi:hypothetical protein
MINRKPLYIKLNNSIVDLSQITVIQTLDVPSDPQPYGRYKLHMYIGKEMAFVFLYENQEARDRAMKDIQNILI